ncbi:MAG: hypothetical protein M1570_15285 [Chloroflexi bacterium]|nr:hypothetical protein [Chloroflexota bacterium]
MVKHRSVNRLIALIVVVLALVSVGTALSAQRLREGADINRTAVLDWYLAHERSNFDGDNNVIYGEMEPAASRWATLDWYLAHEQTTLDEVGNVLSK